MFNCLLDRFPTEYKGYPINTDFRVGIAITLLLEDNTILDDDMRFLSAFKLLYKEAIPQDTQVAYDGLMWFLSCGKSELIYEDAPIEESSPDKCIDFNVDHLDIWGAFWAKGVDLTKVTMHWFKFMTAISNLGDCALTQKMQYRSADLKNMKGDTKKYYKKLKEKYKVRKVITKEEQDKFLADMEAKFGKHHVKLYKQAHGIKD
jgi:hypothetical protein